VDHIKSQVDNLSELSDEQVSELQASIIGEFESVEASDATPETVDAMTTLADMLDTVRGETKRREAAAEELSSRAAEATARVKGDGQDEMSGTDSVDGEESAMDSEDVMPADDAESTPAVDGGELDGVTPSDETIPSGDVAPTQEETPEEEKGETPAEEEEEDKKSASEYSADSAEASIETGENTEFSTDETTPTQETPIAEEVQQEEQAPVTASVEGTPVVPADRRPVVQVVETAPVAITAGADIPGYTAGAPISNMQEVAVAMEKRLHSLRRVSGGDGEQHIVASFATSYPEARTLTTDAVSNASKIEAVSSPEAITASGGYGTPFEVKYDIFGLGSSTVRPVRDALPAFQAERGGIRFITPPTLVHDVSGTATYDYDTATTLWTAANDSATTPSPATKRSLTVAATSEQTVAVDAVTLQLQFGNLMTRAYPELIARHNELGLVQQARVAELQLLSTISTKSTKVNAHVATTEAASLIGAARDILVQIRKAAVAYRSRHRLDTKTTLKAIVPEWIYDAMAADLILNMPGDGNLGVTSGEIDGYLKNSNVDLVASKDLNSFGTQQGSANRLLEFPDTFKWYLFAEGSFIFLDGGTLDLGIIRDSSLVGTNDYKMFLETFEAAAFVGVESLEITSALSINGVAAALRDTTGNATAAAIEE